MDATPPAKLDMKDHMLVFAAVGNTYGRDCAFDIATKSAERLLKLVAVASADESAALVLLHDLATLRQKREGTPEDNARRWQRRVNRALDRARYDTPPPSAATGSSREKELA